MKKTILMLTFLLSLMSSALSQNELSVTNEQAIEIARQYVIENKEIPEDWFGGGVNIQEVDGNLLISFTAKPNENGVIIAGDHFMVILSPKGEVLDYVPGV